MEKTKIKDENEQERLKMELSDQKIATISLIYWVILMNYISQILTVRECFL